MPCKVTVLHIVNRSHFQELKISKYADDAKGRLIFLHVVLFSSFFKRISRISIFPTIKDEIEYFFKIVVDWISQNVFHFTEFFPFYGIF